MRTRWLILLLALAPSSSWPTVAWPAAPPVTGDSTERRELQDRPAKAPSERRRLYDLCLAAASLARKRTRAFLTAANRGISEPREQHLPFEELSLGVEEMLQVHDRFLKTLSERQWNQSEGDIAKLEMLRAAVHAKLQGIDLELRMPKPDAKVLARYARRINGDLKDWEKLYRKIGYSEGSGEGDRSASGSKPNFSMR